MKKLTNCLIACLNISSVIFFKDGLNLSSSQTKAQLLENRTIQNYVEAYVDKYVGECTVALIPKYFGFCDLSQSATKDGFK